MTSDTMYCTFEDVADLIGASPEDFRFLNKQMNYDQFKDLINSYIQFATDEIDRYCNVKTFHEHEVTDELHSMVMMRNFPYATGYSAPLLYGIYDSQEDYTELSREIFPREYPVKEITSVDVAFQPSTGGQVWKHLTERSPGVNGDYNVIQRFDHTHIQISRQVPRYGVNNCKISYVAGYPEGHQAWSQLKMACIMIVNNILNYKKASQEMYTIRGSSVQSYSPMFDNGVGGAFMTPDVMAILNRYRRPYGTPDAYV